MRDRCRKKFERSLATPVKNSSVTIDDLFDEERRLTIISKIHPYIDCICVNWTIGMCQACIRVMPESILNKEILPFTPDTTLKNKEGMCALFLKGDARIGAPGPKTHE